MLQEAPGGRVALRRDEIAPVLPDEPGTEEGRDLRSARQFPELGDAACYEDREDHEPERELVDAKPADVDARTEPVPFQVQHEARVGRDGERPMRGSSDCHLPASTVVGVRVGVLFVMVSVVAVAVGCGSGGSTTTHGRPQPPRALAVYAAGKRIDVIQPALRRIRLPARIDLRRGRAWMEDAIPRRPARRLIDHALAAHATRVEVPVVPLRSRIALRPVRQVFHNDCEAASLSMLLAAGGVHAGQLELQARLPRSGPLDPEPVAGNRLFRWGDPERGFVGRPAGGGTEGGFGVYEPPIRALAARYGVRLLDLRGRGIAAVRAAVLAGHPVLAWVGLASGPYLSWLTPSGREITVNLNEHAVVLVGAGRRYVLVNNPLTGVRERWTDALFSYRWRLLGRRALELPLS